MKIDPALAQQELQRICAEKGGVLQAEDVVAAARPHNSILHRYFEWDDTIAAELFRQDQARRLIKIYVVPIEVEKTLINIPIFVNEGPGQGYVPIYEVMDDATRLRNLAAQAFSRAIDILSNCPHPRTQKLARTLEKERGKL